MIMEVVFDQPQQPTRRGGAGWSRGVVWRITESFVVVHPCLKSNIDNYHAAGLVY
jgi:hypothetical protein